MAHKGQKQQPVDPTMKEYVVERHLTGGVSYGVLAKEYGIPYGTICTWVYQYRKRGEVPSNKKGRPGPREDNDYKEKYEIPKKFLVFCEKVDHLKK